MTDTIEPTKKMGKTWLFGAMVRMPWPFLVVMPVVFAFLIGFGWTQDDYIEEQVSRIWIPTTGDYARDVEYAENVGKDRDSGTSIAAMAIARDGGNLFTQSRLEEIRQRMEKTEATTITWKEHTITWEDICALNNAGRGTTYEFPCTRLSPMDLFQEARWFFEENDRLTWYDEVIGKLLVKPRIPRFGIMQSYCGAQCFEVVQARTNLTYALAEGYPASHVQPLLLFDDIGSMEMNHKCRSCIEMSYDVVLGELTLYAQGSFGVLAQEMDRFLNTGNVTDEGEQTELQQRVQQYGFLAQTITRADVEEYYTYSVIRNLYAQFGARDYALGYANILQLLLPDCLNSTAQGDGLQCPSPVMNAAIAMKALVDHADGEFSSLNTAGSPFPFWSSNDGTGNLFEGTSFVSGSGVDLSGDPQSIREYLDLDNVRNQSAWRPEYSAGFADPITPDANWTKVESNPMYKWFMASLEPSDKQCGNSLLKGTNSSSQTFNAKSAGVMAQSSQRWCTKYNIPNSDDAGTGGYTKQYFAKMWYDLLLDSDQFLGITQGEDDPYSWTSGSGCGYTLGGERNPYTGLTDAAILGNASRDLYYIDEGLSLGPVDRHLLLGGVSPSIEEYGPDNHLETVGVLQTLYFGLMPDDIVNRVKNCNRPGGAITDMTEDDAKDILEAYKEAFENNWSEGWDNDNAGEVQFVLFSDESGSIGTTGRILRDITLDNGKLMSISIILIALFSVILLVAPDWIESRVLITLIGVSLVVLAFFASLGLAILAGIKINITIAWTLPFIILGIGVDDVYIVLMSLKKQGGYSKENFLRAMQEVAVPVTMTSIVNCLMFAVMNISDIAAVYKTATTAVICIIALYLSVLFCFPAYCWLDMKRQQNGYMDFFFCFQASQKEETVEADGAGAVKRDVRHVWLYEKFYYPLVLGAPMVRMMVHAFLFLGTATLLAVGIYGITEHEVGLGLEDFYPSGTQALRWATVRTEELASWSIGINWGALNYTDPTTQMKMIKQFEDVVATEHVANVDTRLLWMADFLMWTTHHCTDNFDRSDPEVKECGIDQLYEPEGTTCVGSWARNMLGLREKIFDDPLSEQCEPYEGGICRPTSNMFPWDLQSAGYDATLDAEASWCPVTNWSEEKFEWCISQWRNITNYGGGRFVFESDQATETDCPGEFYRDEALVFPIPYSAGPTMFSYDLFSHELTLDLLEQTRNVCDRDSELHCWMTGIPYDYWTQYEDVFEVLFQLSFISAAVGFGVAWIFLFVKLATEKRHPLSKVFVGSLMGAILITLTILTCLITVIGLSVLAGVSMTGFSNMAFVLSVGFSVEYSVHVVSRWIRAPNRLTTSKERVEYTMSFLMLPTFMSWISSTIGVVCLAFTEFEFTEVFFFRPLIIMMMVTYFVGCYALPAALCYIEHDVCRLGKGEFEASSSFAPKPINAVEETEQVETMDYDDSLAKDQKEMDEDDGVPSEPSAEKVKDEPSSMALQ